MPCLISNGGHVLEFQQLPSRFGTSPENEIVVQPGLGVAGHHFVLMQENGHLVLESTGQGATSVNGNSVRRTGIRDGDRIQVGELMLVYSAHARPVEPVAAATSDESMAGMTAAPGNPLSAGNSGIQGTTAPNSGGPAHEAVSDALSTLSHSSQSPFQASGAEDTPDGPAPAPSEAPVPTASEAPVPTASPTASPPPATAPAEASQPANSFEAWLASSQAAFDGSEASTNASPSTEAQASPVTPNPTASGQGDLNAETEDLAAIFQGTNDAEEGNDLAEVFLTNNSEAGGPEDGNDLAEVFLTDNSEADGTEAKDEETDIAQEKVIEAIDIEIPALPEIEEAEKSGATVTAAQLPGNAIKPSGMGAKARRKPLPPIRMGTDEDEEAPEGPGNSGGSKAPGSPAGGKRRRWSWRTRQSTPLDEATQAQRVTAKALDRLAKNNKGPRYQRLIPWHQVGLAACLIFAAAGAYLATSGQHHVERTLNMLGFATESGHSDYVRRLSFMEPEALVTVDMERAIDLYKRWSKSENWLTIGNLNDTLDQFAEGFSLTNLDRVTLSMDAQGRTLALLSSKREWTRRDLVRDLGRGLLSLERVGDISVHEGFLGRRTEIKFALLNPKTLVIGDPELTTKFLSAPEAAPTGRLIDRPSHALAKTTRDWLGFYVAQSSWERLKALLPEPIKPTADRVLAYVKSSTAENGRLLGRIGVDVSVHADFDFASPRQAAQFAEGWGTMAQERLAELMNLMGPHGKALIGAQTDLKRCKIQAENQRASLALSVANRWATLDTLSVKSTFLEIAKVMQTDPNPAPSLMTPDELEARETAHQIAYKYERGLEAGAKELEGINDLETIVKTLANGVRGSGPYRNVTYRVPSAKKLLPRVVELLEWTDTGKVTVNPIPETVSAKVDGKTLMSKNEADESPEEP